MRVDFGRIALRFLSMASVAAVAGISAGDPANAGDQIFDELRFGVSTSVQSGHSREDGVFPEITALFDPFGYKTAVGWQQQLLHPRVHLGTSIGTSGEATQFFTGFTWTVDFNEKLFAEAGFGGVIHTGDLDGDDDGPELGCRVLFHEYLGAGYRFNAHWMSWPRSPIPRMPISAMGRTTA